MEIERRFLVTKKLNLNRFSLSEIEQTYLAIADNTEVRVRKSNGVCTLTLKVGKGEERIEKEFVIPAKAYSELRKASELRISKTRYTIPFYSRVIELDVFKDSLEGLKIAEIEFNSEKEANSFKPPQWFGIEVTNNEQYKNSSLVLYGLPERRKSLKLTQGRTKSLPRTVMR